VCAAPEADTESRAADWAFCALRGDACKCEGLVRFGIPGDEKWGVNVVDGTVNCTDRFLRAGGADASECQCKPVRAHCLLPTRRHRPRTLRCLI
jgi:hypothetical protein